MTSDSAEAKTLIDDKQRVSLGRSLDEALAPLPLEPRYVPIDLLGEGGMGEVHLVRDRVVGRDVALKRVRGPLGADQLTRERFLREARVQGQLEHSSIVPVYDLGMTPDQRLFFTMRRVRGRTLDAWASSGDVTRHALLTAMSRVCLAVDFAHSRGVVHRDIKPLNVMVGDFGEVYVLDWGLAKLASSTRDPARPSGPSAVGGASGSAPTSASGVLGTPGYMAPEQVRGEEVDERADVYALGCVLFEVLAGQPLLDFAPMDQMLAATLAGAKASLRERAPERDVPVELEAICVRATKLDRDARFPSARAMSEAIERFLEGDRDLERRRLRGREHAASAAVLAKEAMGTGEPAERARREAMREVGRALTNDPENRDARVTLVRLLTEPPRVAPREVEAQMQEERDARIRAARPLVALAFMSTLLSQALAAWAGIRDMAWYLAGPVCAIAAAMVSMLLGRPRPERRFVVAAIAAAGFVVTARAASPLIVMPAIAMAFGAGLAVFPVKTNATIVAGITAGSIALPFVLEWLGILPPTFHVEQDRIVIEALVVHWRKASALLWFFAATLLPMIATVYYLSRVRDRLLAAEERVRLQAWQLQQILPDEKG